MGVLGLWRLLDATGKPVPLETLEGKVLAIDISIWIHQVIQGYQDRRGNMLPNAHLIGLFNRICKLMYFKIKPVFVFDGGVPLLKKNTIATRRKLKSIAASKAQKLKNDLINNLIKHTAVKGVLDKGNDEGESSTTQQVKDSVTIPGSSRLEDMYKLPEMPSSSQLDSDDYINSDDEPELSPRKQSKWMGNIHTVDVNNEEFKSLPADVRYDILTDLKETRKQNSWGKIHEFPKGSHNYSGFQMTRLLKRRHVQQSLEEAEKEMGGKTLTLEELERLLTDQGIDTTQKQDTAFRIASDSTTRVIYVKDKAATKISERSNDSNSSTNNSNANKSDLNSNSNDALLDSASAQSGSSVAVIDDMGAYDLEEDWHSDEGFTEITETMFTESTLNQTTFNESTLNQTTFNESTLNQTTLNESNLLPKSDIPKSAMNPALAYMLEHSGLSREQILKLVEQSKKNKKKSDAGSSQGSSRRGRKSLGRSSMKNRKKKKLIETTIIQSPEIKQEVESDAENETIPETLHNVESSSDNDDFVEVPEISTNTKEETINKQDFNRTITNESEDSGSDDFIEIQDVPIPEPIKIKTEKTERMKNSGFQITIKANEEIKDDIFADIFADIHTLKKEKASINDEISVFKDLIENNEIKVKEAEISFEKTENVKQSQSLSSNPENSQVENKIMSPPRTPQKQVKRVLSNVANVDEHYINEAAEKKLEEEIVSESEKEMFEKNKDDSAIDDITIISEVTGDTGNSQDLIPDDMFENDDESVVEKEPPILLPVNEEELESMKKQLESERDQIAGNLGKLERQAIDITDQMRLEAQELLRLFGVPYIVAPMEAEAQCAYLEQINLTDGTITDDSDIWLFGGKCVYKNFFDNNKKVLQFLSTDIEHHFKLTRNELIQLALLVGSDYTNGLAGVGPVTALEILASFPTQGEDILRGLRTFSSWFRAGKLTAPTKMTLRNKLKNVQIEKGFPSQAVVQAYLCPTIDESKESFSWAKPNLVLLADYAKKKFGWTKLKFDEIITPVMKKMEESKRQKGIEAYFKVHTVPKSIEAALSKRVQTAVQKLHGKQNDESSDEEASTSTATKSKTKRPRKAPESKTVNRRTKKSKEEPVDLPSIAEANEECKAANESLEEEGDKATKEEECVGCNNDVKEADDGKNIKETRTEISPLKFHALKEEIIPQRERDKVNALNSKLKAIEIFRKSKKGLGRVKKAKKVTNKIKEQAELSEDSSSS